MEHLLGLDFKNFQSLKDTQINLDPGLNVIVGPSNLGKSAAIRGLRALVYNAPAPGLVREGAKELELTAHFADGQNIGLVKGKSKSEYYLNGDMFAKSGASEAPEAIQNHWAIADNKLSFATQHESPFLLAEPASAVAKVLGDLTNASMLMDAVSRCNKLRTGALSDVKARTREAEEARDEIMTHTGLTARGTKLQAAREAFNSAEKVAQRWYSLVSLSERYNELSAEKRELTLLTESSVNLDALIADAEAARVQLESLFSLAERRAKLNREKNAASNEVQFCTAELEYHETQITQLLEEAGMCPLCNQEIEH